MLQSSSSEKKVKPLKNCFFEPNFTGKGSFWATPNGIFFCCRNNKSRSSAFRKFLFYQNIVCFDWVMNLFLYWMFSVKKVSFQLKQLCLDTPLAYSNAGSELNVPQFMCKKIIFEAMRYVNIIKTLQNQQT